MAEEERMGNTDFDRKPDQHDSQKVSGHGQGGQEPTSGEDRDRDAHSLPGTNQAGKGPGENDEPADESAGN
jgi:hypothetical protein